MTGAGVAIIHCTAADHLATIKRLKDEGFEMCADLCAVDYLAHPGRTSLPEEVTPERFEVVVNLLSVSQRKRVRIRTQVSAAEPAIDSISSLYAGAEAMEREAFDMVGVRFEGHPDLTRILMPDDWEGHPLRKDYPVAKVPVQFKAPASARVGAPPGERP